MTSTTVRRCVLVYEKECIVVPRSCCAPACRSASASCCAPGTEPAPLPSTEVLTPEAEAEPAQRDWASFVVGSVGNCQWMNERTTGHASEDRRGLPDGALCERRLHEEARRVLDALGDAPVQVQREKLLRLWVRVQSFYSLVIGNEFRFMAQQLLTLRWFVSSFGSSTGSIHLMLFLMVCVAVVRANTGSDVWYAASVKSSGGLSVSKRRTLDIFKMTIVD